MNNNSFTLLYVEDDKESQKQMKMLLEDSVKELYQAYDGEEGLKIFKEKKPDIVLTDINMPILDGLSMATKIKEIDSKQPIMLMSGLDDKVHLLKAIEIKVDYFITKPINMDILEDALSGIAKKLQSRLKVEAEDKKHREHLYKLAHFDSLTNLPNRLLFDERLESALRQAEKSNSIVTLFFIDLDEFKNINDTYGHAAGDKVLKVIAQNVEACIRDEDTFFRISGDEFSLIIQGVVADDYVDLVSEKVLKATSTTVDFKGQKINVTCSIGISRFPQDSRNKEELTHFADLAMYKAKEQGKSSYIHYKNMRE